MKLIFLHIPKAGGTTFHDILARHYAKDEIFDIRVVDKKLTTKEFLDLPEDQKRKISLLKGHMDFGLHKYFTDKNIRYVTFLRNPVDRVVSLYNYILRRPEHYLYEQVAGGKLSLEDFAKSDLSHEIDNGMVKIIFGNSTIPINQVKESDFEKAKENLLNHFSVIGVMERFDESLLLIRNVLGWKELPFYKRFNVAENGGKEISEKTKKIIANKNQWDIKLYEWVLDNFNQKIKTVPNLAADLEQLQLMNLSFQMGYDEGFERAKKLGFNDGYNYVVNKFLLLKIGKKIKSVFRK